MESVLQVLDRREIEYAEARIFRALLVPRMAALVALAGAIVAAFRLSWRPLEAMLALAAGFVVLAVQTELKAHRQWKEAARHAAAAMGLPPRIDSRPTVP